MTLSTVYLFVAVPIVALVLSLVALITARNSAERIRQTDQSAGGEDRP